MSPEPATYPGYRFPAEIISHAMWLYHVFSLSLDGQYPQNPTEIGTWFQQTAAAWNHHPTPFLWNGKRRQRVRIRRGSPFGAWVNLSSDLMGARKGVAKDGAGWRHGNHQRDRAPTAVAG
ncbi:hypothetical protein [Belnapia rosea]|uniref:hypothetical protein n=1 Tax=Belnapia rosea TaxID=938405 RepID=UPI0015A31DF8|nr:hypothetical protein [Belnapia rosea]